MKSIYYLSFGLFFTTVNGSELEEPNTPLKRCDSRLAVSYQSKNKNVTFVLDSIPFPKSPITPNK